MKTAISEHRLWLISAGEGGRRATFTQQDLRAVSLEAEMLDFAELTGSDLSESELSRAWLFGADLSGAKLRSVSARGCNLSEANLSESNLEAIDLRDARLVGSNLYRANLRYAKLAKADLGGANLVGADLAFCDLSETLHLNDFQLQGANLEGGILPKGLTFSSLASARMCTSYARKLFAAQLLICAYLVVFLFLPALSQQRFERPPFFPFEVDVNKIPVLVAWLSAIVAANFRYYLARAWEQISLLPAVLPDGSSYEDYVDPWFVMSYSRIAVSRLYVPKSRVLEIEALVAGAVAYLLVPVTIFVVTQKLTMASKTDVLRTPLFEIPMIWSMLGGVVGLFSTVVIQMATGERGRIREITRAAEVLAPIIAVIGTFIRSGLWKLILFVRQWLIGLFT